MFCWALLYFAGFSSNAHICTAACVGPGAPIILEKEATEMSVDEEIMMLLSDAEKNTELFAASDRNR